MINSSRIVPVGNADLLSLYGLVLKQNSNNSSLAKLASSDVVGNFAVTGSGVLLANQPLKSLTFGSSVTSATVYFVADIGYEGFKKTGATLTVTAPSGGVKGDCTTLYKAVLSTNALTITVEGF